MTRRTRQHSRGVVECKECMKPRCLYSTNAPARMKPPVGDDGQEPTTEAIRACREYAVQQLDAAKENELYVCGMQPLDPDNLMYGVITARSGIECHDHVEFETLSTSASLPCSDCSVV